MLHQYDATPYHVRLGAWVRPHLRRRAFVKRLHDLRFTLPEA
jgi:hypothetical protein